ncbi:13659_t:CDS:2, partial [Funneliformis mosseae]
MGGKIIGTNPPQQRKPRPPPTTDSTKPSRPPATSIIPPELFITICEPLTPDDLFSLSHAIHMAKVKVDLLIISYLTPPPPPPHGSACPDDMDERIYILMTNIAIRCQFCRDRSYTDSAIGLFVSIGIRFIIGLDDATKAKLERYMSLIERHEWEFKNEMTKWSYQTTLSLQEIRLRSSYMAEEIASDMNLDPEKLKDWEIYWYPMDTKTVRNLTEDDWDNWRVEVETECKKIRRKSQKWFNRFSRASIT